MPWAYRQAMLASTGRGAEVVQVAPTHCPAGHHLGPRRVRVAYLPCSCAGSGGHHSWTCVECGHTTYDPMHTDPRQAGGPRAGALVRSNYCLGGS